MNHPTEDQIVLLLYGELPDADARQIEAHVAGCATCGETLQRLERARGALDLGLTQSKPRIGWIATGAAAAAAVVALWLTNLGPPRQTHPGWQPTLEWSGTAGYVTGGRAMAEIDDQLTRLEQERFYGWPH